MTKAISADDLNKLFFKTANTPVSLFDSVYTSQLNIGPGASFYNYFNQTTHKQLDYTVPGTYTFTIPDDIYSYQLVYLSTTSSTGSTSVTVQCTPGDTHFVTIGDKGKASRVYNSSGSVSVSCGPYDTEIFRITRRQHYAYYGETFRVGFTAIALSKASVQITGYNYDNTNTPLPFNHSHDYINSIQNQIQNASNPQGFSSPLWNFYPTPDTDNVYNRVTTTYADLATTVSMTPVHYQSVLNQDPSNLEAYVVDYNAVDFLNGLFGSSESTVYCHYKLTSTYPYLPSSRTSTYSQSYWDNLHFYANNRGNLVPNTNTFSRGILGLEVQNTYDANVQSQYEGFYPVDLSVNVKQVTPISINLYYGPITP